VIKHILTFLLYDFKFENQVPLILHVIIYVLYKILFSLRTLTLSTHINRKLFIINEKNVRGYGLV